MARMLPELNVDQLRAFRSRAEARIYEALRDSLLGDVLVIHSASWIYRDTKNRFREGEADFVVVLPQSGILAIEVKGGGIAFDAPSGQWFSVDRNNQKNQIKDPFRQAKQERFSILDQLTGHPLWRQWKGKRLTLGHAVMLPDIDDAKPLHGPDRPKEIIGVSKDVATLGPWLERVITFWRHEDDDPLKSQGAQLVEEILCKSIEVRPILRPVLDDTERQRIRLTNNQAKVLRTIGGRKRAVISGGAGTGKTLIAVEKARQLASTGLRVLLLCYNRPLADALADSLNDEPRISVLTYHQLCDQRISLAKKTTGRNLLAEAGRAYPGDSQQHLFDVQMPYALALSNELLEKKYDAVVVDEAQDFSDEYWFAIEELLHDPSQGWLYVFIDQNQALYHRHANLPVPDEPFHLTVNCRNTAPIHDLGYSYYKGETIDRPELAGPPIEFLAAETDAAQADSVYRRVRQLIVEDRIDPRDIAVLIAKRPKAPRYELLTGHALPSGIGWAVETHGRERMVLVDSVARFKGLESQAVVLWLGDGLIEQHGSEIIYVGTTRAKSFLCLVGSASALTILKCS